MTEDEKENPKGISGRKKPSSSRQLLPLEVGEAICGCIAKMSRPCTRKKLCDTNLSKADMEYVRITHIITME
eukprot:scaffold12887_cov65-Attheya_sp.AAC.2